VDQNAYANQHAARCYIFIIPDEKRAAAMLKILGKSTSINVRKVLWTCEEVGLDYQLEQYGSGYKPTDTPEFLALNPNGQVPVLIDEGFVLWESNTICRYLVGKAGREDLLSGTPRGRARVEKWMDWQATELNSAWQYAFNALVRRNPDYASQSDINASIADWNRCIVILERELEQSGLWVTGQTFTLADIVLGLSVNRWKMTPFERPDVPAVDAWFARLGQRPAFRRHGDNGTP